MTSFANKQTCKGANINHKTAGGLTALHWAVVKVFFLVLVAFFFFLISTKGHFGITKLLADKGANMLVRAFVVWAAVFFFFFCWLISFFSVVRPRLLLA